MIMSLDGHRQPIKSLSDIPREHVIVSTAKTNPITGKVSENVAKQMESTGDSLRN